MPRSEPFTSARTAARPSSTLATAPDVVAVPIGAFADPTFPPPRISVYESRRHPWLEVTAEMEHHD